MKKKAVILFFIMASFLWTGLLEAQKAELPASYKKWLEEEVVHIMTPVEREVFLQLKTDRERDLFREAFWKQRDPTPSSPENEFKNEHYRRINYANHFFGRQSPKPGWKTDRGRIYVILGEPVDIQRYEGKTGVYPSEVWFYQGKSDLGLPPGFYLVFYQRGGTGDSQLYSPLQDGPQALLSGNFGDPSDYLSAYEQLKEIVPQLADISLNLIPGERSADLNRPDLASDLLIQNVEKAPQKQVENRYAQKFLLYKDIVETEYTANYINSDSLIKVIKTSPDAYFVHYAIEPERLSVDSYENKYHTTLKLNGTVTNTEGKIIYQFERPLSLEFNEDQMRNINVQPFNLHDMFPLIPGEYRFSVLVKNEISKEFTSVERTLLIPQNNQIPQMTSLILAYKIARNTMNQKGIKPFQIGSYQIYPQPNRVFLKQDNLALVFQIHGLSREFKEQGEIKFTFFKSDEMNKNDEMFFSLTRKIVDYSDQPNFIEEFSLREFPASHYRIQCSLLLNGQERLTNHEEFDITYSETIARPWIHTRVFPGPGDPIYSYIIGTELFNSGKIDQAGTELEKGLLKKPDSADYALALAQVYMALAEYDKIELLLLPFLGGSQPAKYEVFFLLGKAYQNRGELSKAIELFDKAISHFGLNINLLNSIGECHLQLGNKKEALQAFEKSLEINPNQPEVKKNIDSLKEKNG